jgi:hypothetical protein
MLTKLRRDGYGPLIQIDGMEALADLVRVSEKAWELYAESFVGVKEVEDRDAADVLSKLIYHAQNCSYTIGLLSTWAQPLEALILLRTRFEQTLTASCLVHFPKEEGLKRFIEHQHRLSLNMMRKMRNSEAPLTDFIEALLGDRLRNNEDAAIRIEKSINPEYEAGQRLDESWTSMDKLTLARKRDKAAKQSHEIAAFRLEDYYHGMYRFGTGMAHVDASTLTAEYLSTSPDGVTLMPQLGQLVMNLVQCAHFDLFQSFETTEHLGVANVKAYEELNDEFKAATAMFIGPDLLFELLGGETLKRGK